MDMVTGRLKQVGQGKRKEGPYGGCFGLHEVGSDAFVARPGFRIWSVNNNGEVSENEVEANSLKDSFIHSSDGIVWLLWAIIVCTVCHIYMAIIVCHFSLASLHGCFALFPKVAKTVKLKDEILSPTALPILLLGQEHKYVPPSADNAHFSLLLPWQSRYLVTFWQKYLWVLDPVQCCVIGALCYPRNIISVATCNDDIYMLSHDKSIVTKLSIRFDLQKFRPYVVPHLEDKGRDKEGIECVDSGAARLEDVKGPTSLEDTEDHLHEVVPASVGAPDSDLLSSAKACPLALMERDQQLKRLVDFDTEQDISMLVKQVKKKGKRKGT